MKFINGIKTIIDGLVRTVNDSSYMSWATALSLAGRPSQKIAMFGDKPYLQFLGGAVVAIDMESKGEGSANSRVWLPVMDDHNSPISIENINAKHITDSIARCKAKSIALNTGIGMSVYSGHDEDLKGFLNQLGVTPDSDLSEIEPSVIQGKFDYIQWSDAYAAAKITDPSFTFQVCSFPDPESDCSTPIIQIGQGYSVAVQVSYKGDSHTEWLPILDMDNQIIDEPNVFDWNKTVMRALTKAIAIVSGYGLNIYAKEELSNLMDRKPIERKAKGKNSQKAGPQQKELPAATHPAVSVDDIALLRMQLSDTKQSEKDLLEFLESPETSLDNVSPECFNRARLALNPPIH